MFKSSRDDIRLEIPLQYTCRIKFVEDIHNDDTSFNICPFIDIYSRCFFLIFGSDVSLFFFLHKFRVGKFMMTSFLVFPSD